MDELNTNIVQFKNNFHLDNRLYLIYRLLRRQSLYEIVIKRDRRTNEKMIELSDHFLSFGALLQVLEANSSNAHSIFFDNEIMKHLTKHSSDNQNEPNVQR